MKQQKLKIIYMLILTLSICVSISCSSVIVRFPILNDVQLNELQICDEEITQETNETEKQKYCDNIFSSDKEELHLCGDVSGIRDVDASLGIFLYKEGIERPVFYNKGVDGYTNGYFCRIITMPNKDSRKGNYVIELHHARNVLDSIEFEIR